MEVILLQKVDNLGGLGDRVRVRAGYGRNYLVPTGKATPATAENIQKFEERRAELEKAAADQMAVAQSRAEKLEGVSVVIKARSAGEGKLYGSVNTVDVALALSEAGYDVAKQEIRLHEGPIRTAGDHSVGIHLHADLEINITVNVIGEE